MVKQRLAFENELVKYIEDEYFGGDRTKLAEHTGYTKQQIGTWADGSRKPRGVTMRYLLSSVLAPEFKIVCEFVPINITVEKDISHNLRKALGKHHDRPGIYAFYDSLCNLFYVGKTAAKNGLYGEMYQQLKNPLGMTFPKALIGSPKSRWQAAAFISAYEVPLVAHLDYPKHVESLVLRLSKPVGNKILGGLNIAIQPQEVD
jgi:hypothetical protein